MDLQERMSRGFHPDYSQAYDEARRVIAFMGNENAELSTYHEEQPCDLCGREEMSEGCTSDDCPSNTATPIEKITENTVGTIIAIAAHETKENVYIILGREDHRVDGFRPDSFFTREASGVDGSQFWGHYRLTLGEAFTDYEERLGRTT